MRKVVIAGNWKMHKTADEAVSYIQLLKEKMGTPSVSVFLAVPFTAIKPSALAAEGSLILIGAQNMHNAEKGAFTGEIAAEMLLEEGASFVLLGHSERRRIFHEDDKIIRKKLERALESGLTPILCIGESEDEREQKKTEEILRGQLHSALKGLKKDDMYKIVIAYEPVWAIGTGKTATVEIAEKAHSFVRSVVEELFGDDCARSTVIQYGGSATADNAAKLVSSPNIDGLLVGGASLDVDSFLQIIQAANQVIEQGKP